MPSRQETIAQSIQYSITYRDKQSSFLSSVSGYFYTHWLTFARVRPDLFENLRKTWDIKNQGYLASFGGQDGDEGALKSMGDMGSYFGRHTQRQTRNSLILRLLRINILYDSRLSLPCQVDTSPL